MDTQRHQAEDCAWVQRLKRGPQLPSWIRFSEYIRAAVVCGANSQFPCDNHGHGTHTTGTSMATTLGQTRITPGAKWIGFRNMDQGTGTPATYSECFQF